jgi:hypothetical protein
MELSTEFCGMNVKKLYGELLMTRPLYHDNKEATQFSRWLRNCKDIDSHYGYVATDSDFFWGNRDKKFFMLLEEKRYMNLMTLCQQKIFRLIDFSIAIVFLKISISSRISVSI